METQSITQKKNTFTIPYSDHEVTLSGNFDSGNLNWAGVDLQKEEIQLLFGKDKQIKPSSKTWFYFSIEAENAILPLKLNLLKVNTLNVVAKIYDLYRPVIKVEGGQWQRLSTPVDFEVTAENDVNMRMTINMTQSNKIYIALCYPWSFQENEQYLKALEIKMKSREDIYFNKETLILSPQKRPIHLIALTSSEASKYPQQRYIEHLFPLREDEAHFKEVHKPMIFITSRVHPGEIGSSYALKGMIQFLISDDPEASKILNQFYFMIIPMLNPDGVCNGNNRMDSLGQNLNRFYHLPELEMQPSCYALKSLVENSRKEIFAFFDLHGHANKKSCFLFGNSINNIRMQTESVLFAKYLSTICEHIEFKTCNFSKRQMSSKDKNQDLSKEGCARVVVHRWTNSPYCYTLETGLYKNVKVDEKGITRYGEKFYSPDTYHEVGAKMIITLFRILKKNKQIEEMKKFCADYVIKLEKINTKKEKVIKIEKNSTQKSIKQLKSQSQQQQKSEAQGIESEQLTSKSLGGKQNQENSSCKKDRCREIEAALHKNKNYLLNSNEDEDDQNEAE